MAFPHAEVIGDPIAHSKSPVIHRFWLEKLGLRGDYVRTRVREEGLLDFFEKRRDDPDWRGCNVTVPHKRAVRPLLDVIDRYAARLGAVNTVVAEDGKLHGYNTDGPGFVEPLRPLLRQPHLFRMARLFGTGGAARAIAHALADEGFTLVVIGRSRDKAEAIVAELAGEHHVATLDHFAEPTDFVFDDRAGILDLVVNATTLGMGGSAPLLLDFSHVPPGAVVYDIVYAPLETPLLAEARARGLSTIDGLAMLIGQAAEAFARFFGKPAPRQHDAELRALLTR